MNGKLEQFRHHLTEQGHRVTAQRLAIYQVLLESSRHPSAEEIFRRVREDFPMTSPATVYNTLQLLVNLGFATQMGFRGEARFDSNPSVHVNLLCVQCKRIVDVEDDLTEALARSIQGKSAFQLLRQRHEFSGVCPECVGQ